MEEIQEAFEIVFGKEFVNEMATRLIIIVCSLVAILLVVLIISAWKAIACKKIRKAILALSEHPDNEHAELCIKSVSTMSSFGKFLAKHSKGFSGLSKGESRSIYNQTVLTSNNISPENKKEVRTHLMLIGCDGLTDL